MIGCFVAAAAASTTCSSSRAPQHRHLPGGRMPARCPVRVLKAPWRPASSSHCRADQRVQLLYNGGYTAGCLIASAGKAGGSQRCCEFGLVGSVKGP